LLSTVNIKCCIQNTKCLRRMGDHIMNAAYRMQTRRMLMTVTGAEPSVIALAMGDPAGVSPELTARLLALPDVRKEAHIIVFGDRRILVEVAYIAGVKLYLQDANLENAPNMPVSKHVFVDLKNLDPKDVVRSEATLIGGTFATQNFRTALKFANAGHAQAVCF